MRRTAIAVALAALMTLGVAPVAPVQAADDGTITGADGVEYPKSPPVVAGRHEDRFDGYTFDIICRDAGPGLASDMKRLTKVIRLIEASGRRVVLSVLPPKALVNTGNVKRSRLPHGQCDRSGLDQQAKVFDTYGERTYLDGVRKALANDGRQMYWRTDPHWTTVAASIWTKMLATRLDPAVGAEQKYKKGEPQTAAGALGDGTPETVPTLVPAGPVKVTPVPGTSDIDSAAYVEEHEWTSSPARSTYPGRTLILGDSFGYMALHDLRPIFRRGDFMWADQPDARMARAVRKADTVVLEIAHLFLGVSPLASKSFRTAVRQALD